MKITLVVIFYICFIINAFSQSEIRLIANPEEAIVYPNQAQLIQHFKTVVIPEGISQIRVVNMTPDVNPNGIAVKNLKGFKLIGVKYQHNFLHPHNVALDDSIKLTQKKLDGLLMEKRSLETEERILVANAPVKSDSKGLTPIDLRLMMSEFRTQLKDLGDRRLKVEGLAAQTKEMLENQKRQKADGGGQRVMGELLLTVETEKATSTTFDLSYLAPQVGWEVLYEVRAENLSKGLKFLQFAKVYQNTGVDWENVKFTLKTTNPYLGSQYPELRPHYLNFSKPQIAESHVRLRTLEAKKNVVEDVMYLEAPKALVFTTLETALDLTYTLDQKFDLVSGIPAEHLSIQEFDIPANYKRFIAPKLDLNAFIVAEIGHELNKYKLINGQASIYFEGSYVGQTYISEKATEESFKISLGRDQRVFAERKSTENYKNRKAIGNTIREDFVYILKIKNNRSDAVDLVVEDQIPISQDSGIEVDIKELSGGSLNEEGKIKWEIQIKANELKEIPLSYSIKYPKDKEISDL